MLSAIGIIIDIAPIVTATAPETLFSTADNFVDASRKLVARKRLVDLCDGEAQG
jgi:hypothetical protein